MTIFSNALEKPTVSIKLKVYIEDDGVPSYSEHEIVHPRNKEWVDFTDKFEANGKDLIRSIGTIDHKTEGKSGISSFVGAINSITVDNSSHFWDKPIPYNAAYYGPIQADLVEADIPSFGNSVPTSLNTVNENIAYFTLSKSYTHTIFEGKKLKIDAEINMEDGSVSTEEMAVVLIRNITRDISNGTATIETESLSMVLKRADAAKCKDAYGWYKNKEVPFLVQKLLETQYGTLPNTWKINKEIIMETSESLKGGSSDNRTLSHYGRPPGYETSSNTWKYKPDPCESLYVWQYITGTVSSLMDYATEVTFSAAFPTSGFRPIIGDTLRIKSGVNEGIYEIIDFDETTPANPIATVTPALKGVTTAAMDYSITRVYMGIGPELWVWDPERNTYYSIWQYDFDEMLFEPIDKLHKIVQLSGETKYYRYKIKRLWYNNNIGKDYIVGAMWTDHVYYYDSSTSDEAILNSATVYLKEFVVVYDVNNPNNHYHSYNIRANPIENVFTGEFCLRYVDPTETTMDYVVGTRITTTVSAGENLALPFPQKIVCVPADSTTAGDDIVSFEWNGGAETVLGQIYTTGGTYFRGNEMSRGYHVVSLMNGNKFIRYTEGQRGFVEFHKNANSTNGSILFCTMTRTTAGVLTNVVNIHHIPINTYATGTEVAITNGTNITQDSVPLYPLCSCVNIGYGTDRVYVAFIGWQKAAGTKSKTYIYAINTSANTWTVDWTTDQKFESDNDGDHRDYLTPVEMIANGATLFMLVFRRDYLNSDDEYKAYEFIKYVTTGTFYQSSLYYRGPTKGLASNAATSEFYFHDSEGNMLIEGAVNGTGYLTEQRLDTGHPPVREGRYLSSNLALDIDSHGGKSTPPTIVYGISAGNTMPIDTQSNVNVKDFYFLWKYDVFFIPLVELADFADLSVDDAIGLLAEIVDHAAGFISDDFFFVAKDLYGEPQITFKNDAIYNRLISFTINNGIDEIYNHASVIPSAVTIEQATGTLGLMARETTLSELNEIQTEKSPDVELNVKQEGTNKRHIRLICIQGGTISDSTVHFKYLDYSGSFETILSSKFDSGSSIYIANGIEDIKAGDVVYLYTATGEVNDSSSEDIFSTYTAYSYIASDPTDEDKEYGKVTLADTYNVDNSASGGGDLSDTPDKGFDEGTKIVIVQSPNSRWSDEIRNLMINPYFEQYTVVSVPLQTATFTGWTINSTPTVVYSNIHVLGSVSMGISNSAINDSRFVYQTINLEDGATYSIAAWVKSKDDGYGVQLIVNNGSTNIVTLNTYSKEWTLAKTVFTTTGNYTGATTAHTIRISCTNDVSSSSRVVYIDSIVLNKGYGATFQYIPVYTYNHWHPIMNSNVFFKFNQTATEEEQNATDYQEGKFKVGDYIDIVCNGEVAKSDTTSKHIALNTASIKAYGRREYPEITNRFANYKTAKHMVQRIVDQYAYPHYNITITAPFLQIINFVDSNDKLGMYAIEEKDVFSFNKNNRVEGHIKEFSYDLNSGTTQLVLRAKDEW